ncbi:MAG: hypothetical protein DSZ02_06135 [Gammaproteobacteria bacterium]|nr:MAG: hypothetical protein DSZ02_06135 [Gammaproteobacteria bacterium]
MAAIPGNKVSRSLLVFLLSGLISQAIASDDGGSGNPIHWLERMNRSVLDLSYEGDFVYLNGKSLEAMRIRHQVRNGEPLESLHTLTGAPREVIRDAYTITIVTQVDGQEKRIQQPSTGKLSPLKPLKPLKPESLKGYYRFVMGKLARIAGRYGVVVMLLPSDDLRYGYRLIIDRQNALPLDLTVMDGAGEPVSRIMFTRLELIGEVEATTDTADAPDMQTPALASTRSVAESETPMTTAAQENGVEDASSWEFKELPPGFRMISYKRIGSGTQEHFVFSDGLATISAYIEPLSEGDRPFDGEPAWAPSMHWVVLWMVSS